MGRKQAETKPIDQKLDLGPEPDKGPGPDQEPDKGPGPDQEPDKGPEPDQEPGKVRPDEVKPRRGRPPGSRNRAPAVPAASAAKAPAVDESAVRGMVDMILGGVSTLFVNRGIAPLTQGETKALADPYVAVCVKHGLVLGCEMQAVFVTIVILGPRMAELAKRAKAREAT